MNRARNFASATNHFMLQGGDELPGPLSDIRVPLLVIHGTADPIFPVEHGIAFAHAVSGAKLVRLEGGGHELHEADFGKIVEAIVEHTAPGRAIERRQR
jgi:pimeloyl-ACP methyl ester carboxylesterase